jgi:hypothetical protein
LPGGDESVIPPVESTVQIYLLSLGYPSGEPRQRTFKGPSHFRKALLSSFAKKKRWYLHKVSHRPAVELTVVTSGYQ